MTWKKLGIGKWIEKGNPVMKYGHPPHPPRVVKVIVPYAFMNKQVYVTEVEYLHNRGIIRSPDFKTKKEALRYAKSYMRKHK